MGKLVLRWNKRRCVGVDCQEIMGQHCTLFGNFVITDEHKLSEICELKFVFSPFLYIRFIKAKKAHSNKFEVTTVLF
jgi:hypothetical protein